jgi:hypothetical protein
MQSRRLHPGFETQNRGGMIRGIDLSVGLQFDDLDAGVVSDFKIRLAC